MPTTQPKSLRQSLALIFVLVIFFALFPAEGLLILLFNHAPVQLVKIISLMNHLSIVDWHTFNYSIKVNGVPLEISLLYIYFVIIGSNIFFIIVSLSILKQYGVTATELGLSVLPGKNTIWKNLQFTLTSIFAIIVILFIWWHASKLAGNTQHFVPYQFYKLNIQALIKPFTEEFLFRGIIFALLLPFMRWKHVIISTSIFFGLVHFVSKPWVEVTWACLVGIILGWLYYRTRSLTYPALVHFLCNFTNGFVQ